MRFLAAAASIFLISVSAAPAELPTLHKRAAVIADGNSVHDGNLPDWNFKYHAAGYLAKGGCPANSNITTCYIYSLSSDPAKNTEQDPYGVTIQDVILNAPSHPADGRIRRYTFKMTLDPSLTYTSSNSCPLVEIVSPDENASIPLNQFTGKHTHQTWTLKSGPGGWADVKVVDEATGATLLRYNATGQNSQGTYYMRVGTDRAADNNLKPLKVYWGDWLGKYI
ncbi:hypothetical protein RhiJN_13075 [Ceratobasidium sp. AG-Ba]|nr:hypothetical protein RhiJN_13075 [Ceratobasidium sp. AG-Ba]